MFVSFAQLRRYLRDIIVNKRDQGHVVAGLDHQLERLPDSYDALLEFASLLADLPLRDDWPYLEPSDYAAILVACDPNRPSGLVRTISLDESAQRVEAAFLGSVCGCMLGKPLEINATLGEIRAALESLGEWPLDDYISRRIAAGFDRPLHPDARETVRENMHWVAPDDDINYTILGMLLIEQHGIGFTQQHVRELWLDQLPPAFMWGPERTMQSKSALYSLSFTEPNDAEIKAWSSVLNPNDETCGAMIRADAYGYACAGNPALAAELAWRDASWTHRRTGIYGAMFTAAAIATAPVAREPLEIFETALRFVPQRSRFYQIVADSLTEVAAASDWLDGYARIHGKYQAYTHCQVYQEVGTLINTLRFAENVGDGICKQVSQGNDTDSYGATAGSILGAFFGPGHLDPRWLALFNDCIHVRLADFYEQSLSQLARRMSHLPGHSSSAPLPGSC